MLKEEIAVLKSRLYPENDAIPESAWNVFTESGVYIKNMLIFSGFLTRESLAKLEKKEELEKIFEFIRDMADDLDEGERRNLLGVFHKNPNKLKILPGLEEIFKTFLHSNKINQGREEKGNDSARKSLPMSSPICKSTSKVDESVTIESVVEQIEEWQLQKVPEEVLKERLKNCDRTLFVETFSMKILKNEIKCKCVVCNTPLAMPKKVQVNKTKLSISNVTRHMKKCWLKPDFQYKKPAQTGIQMSIVELLSVTVPPVRPTFVDLVETERMENMEPPLPGTVHFEAEPVDEPAPEAIEDSGQGHNKAKRAKLETQIKRIQDTTATTSKNLHQPAGI